MSGRLFYRSPSTDGGRKVGTTQSTILPSGKVPLQVETASATENNFLCRGRSKQAFAEASAGKGENVG